ncbi:MAG: hypothetical protein K0R19_2028 [Bacillota bacterium]|jgi:hypothetical protein|nr:hypothetical protein [Bacillota bacterium]
MAHWLDNHDACSEGNAAMKFLSLTRIANTDIILIWLANVAERSRGNGLQGIGHGIDEDDVRDE